MLIPLYLMVRKSIIKEMYSYYLPHTEESDDGSLALADLLYCRGETDDILGIICGLDGDDIQQFVDTQTVDDGKNQVPQ